MSACQITVLATHKSLRRKIIEFKIVGPTLYDVGGSTINLGTLGLSVLDNLVIGAMEKTDFTWNLKPVWDGSRTAPKVRLYSTNSESGAVDNSTYVGYGTATGY